jgi:hypothetical protein
MREIRQSGSEGGGALTGSPYPYSERPRVGCCEELARRYREREGLAIAFVFRERLNSYEV